MATDMETNAQTALNGRTDELDFEKPRSMVDQIYKTLGRAIATGELAPGQVLKEVELQKAFHVSRAPIREAIRLLEADNLVIIDAYKKKYVRPITRQYFRDLMRVTGCLEGFAANLAVDHLTENDVDRLTKINEQMQEAYNLQKYDLCAELNFDFHRIYVKAAKNSVLIATIRSMNKSIIWFWLTNFYFKNRNFIPISISEHRKIIQEFVRRDRDKVEATVRSHVIGIIERSLKTAAFDSNGSFTLLGQESEK